MKPTETGVTSRLTAIIRFEVPKGMVQQKELSQISATFQGQYIAAKIGSDNPPSTKTPPSEPVAAGVVGTSRPRVCLKVVPVKISSRNGAKEIFIHVSVRGQILVPASRALCGS